MDNKLCDILGHEWSILPGLHPTHTMLIIACRICDERYHLYPDEGWWYSVTKNPETGVYQTSGWLDDNDVPKEVLSMVRELFISP